MSNLILNPETDDSKGDSLKESNYMKERPLQGFYIDHTIFKEVITDNLLNVSVKHELETSKNVLYIETDIPGDVVIHWGLCRDEDRNWVVPDEPYPPETILFKNKALRTQLQVFHLIKNMSNGSLF